MITIEEAFKEHDTIKIVYVHSTVCNICGHHEYYHSNQYSFMGDKERFELRSLGGYIPLKLDTLVTPTKIEASYVYTEEAIPSTCRVCNDTINWRGWNPYEEYEREVENYRDSSYDYETD